MVSGQTERRNHSLTEPDPIFSTPFFLPRGVIFVVRVGTLRFAHPNRFYTTSVTFIPSGSFSSGSVFLSQPRRGRCICRSHTIHFQHTPQYSRFHFLPCQNNAIGITRTKVTKDATTPGTSLQEQEARPTRQKGSITTAATNQPIIEAIQDALAMYHAVLRLLQ